MTMAVKYNSDAQFALGELNKNNRKLSKTLAKISSRQRIVNADDSGSDYSISEKMRTRIRALFQDNQNVQNGSSMVKIAERGVDQIVQTLRTMKELAIDAANDSNTDEDRRTIQKELDQCRETINDVAIGSQYNGKILLDGRWRKGTHSDGGGSIDSAGAFNNNVTGFFDLPKSVMIKSGEMSWANGKTAYRSSANTFVPLNFSRSTASNFPNDMDKQGFSILCTVGGCPSFYGFVFDSSKEIGESEVKGTDNAPVYVVGIKGANTAQKISEALFKGVANAIGQTDTNTLTLTSNHTVTLKKDGNNYSITQNFSFYIYEGYSASYAEIDPDDIPTGGSKGVPLWIQHGTQAGQRMHIFIGDMRSSALGIDNAKVTTRENANDAIDIIESAIEAALDEATNLGAYLQRLEYTDANITTMNENVQAAESTIRDADISKEMVEYTKYNLLTQSSQSMLAQANQNGSSVLGLLQ